MSLLTECWRAGGSVLLTIGIGTKILVSFFRFSVTFGNFSLSFNQIKPIDSLFWFFFPLHFLPTHVKTIPVVQFIKNEHYFWVKHRLTCSGGPIMQRVEVLPPAGCSQSWCIEKGERTISSSLSKHSSHWFRLKTPNMIHKHTHTHTQNICHLFTKNCSGRGCRYLLNSDLGQNYTVEQWAKCRQSVVGLLSE